MSHSRSNIHLLPGGLRLRDDPRLEQFKAVVRMICAWLTFAQSSAGNAREGSILRTILDAEGKKNTGKGLKNDVRS